MIAAKLDHMQEHSGVLRATNRTYDEWFALLDRWGASGRPISEIADWLEGEHGLSSWWAQKLITEYEQARALRPPGVRPGGTFTVGASKTVQVPVERLYDAFVDPEDRTLAARRRDARTHLAATSVGLREHERLPDQETAQKTRAFWSERLTALKAELEDHRE